MGCSIHEFEQYYQGGFLGVSRDGSPIVCRKYGALDLKAFSSCAGKLHREEVRKLAATYFVESHVWEMEWYHDVMKRQR